MKTYCGVAVKRLFTVTTVSEAKKVRAKFEYAVIRVVGNLYQVVVIEE